MTQAVMNRARQFPGQGAAVSSSSCRRNPGMRQQIQAPIFEDKVVDYIFELAKVTEKTVSKDELQKAVEAIEED